MATTPEGTPQDTLPHLGGARARPDRAQASDAATRAAAQDHAIAPSEREADASRNTLRSIILGLLGAHPMSGYDIKRAFDRSLATYWNAGSSQIFPPLRARAARGLVNSELVYQGGRPNRRVYGLTEAGRAALDTWLAEPVPARFTKDEFLTKLFFCGQTSDGTALRHLEEHVASLREQLADMERALREYGGRPTPPPRPPQ